MATTTSAKAARKAARESALAANADLARRTKLNVEDLTRFFTSMSRADGVDEWLDEKVAALKEQARRRRDGERRQAGAALAAMRERGEQVREIASLAHISEKQVRELIRQAGAGSGDEATAQPGPEDSAGSGTESAVAAVPGDGGDDVGGDGSGDHGVRLAAVGG